MDQREPCKELAGDFTRQSLTAISYGVPDSDLSADMSPKITDGEKVVEPLIHDGEDILISICYSPSPDADCLPENSNVYLPGKMEIRRNPIASEGQPSSHILLVQPQQMPMQSAQEPFHQHHQKGDQQNQQVEDQQHQQHKDQHQQLQQNQLAEDQQLGDQQNLQEKDQENEQNKEHEEDSQEEDDDEEENEYQTDKQDRQQELRRRRKRTDDADNRISTRMSPKQFYATIQNLTMDQKKAVQDIGFGSLLDMKMSECEGRLSKFLVERFDVCRCGLDLGKEEIILTNEDVFNTMGFPRGSNPVVEGNGHETPEYENILRIWRERWGLRSGSPSTINIGKQLITRTDYGDWFKRDFVVFTVSSIIRGHVNRYSHYKILYSLIDVNGINDLNWCAYTLNSLLRAVESWKMKHTYFTGPLLFLMLSYLDRVQFKGKSVERTLPLIKSWTSKAIRTRVSDELKAGGFGKGLVIKRLKRTEPEQSTRDPSLCLDFFDHPTTSTQTKKTTKESIDKLSVVLGKMASNVMEFGDIMVKIGQTQPAQASGTLEKTFSTISELLSNVSSQSTPTASDSEKNDDDIFNDPTFLNAVANLDEAFLKTNKHFKVPLFDLGLGLTPDEPTTTITEDQVTTASKDTRLGVILQENLLGNQAEGMVLEQRESVDE